MHGPNKENSLQKDRKYVGKGEMLVTKLKGFAGGKINATTKLQLVLERLENIVRNGDNACNQTERICGGQNKCYSKNCSSFWEG